MRLRTIKGRSMPEALERVQKELGPNALVLETSTSDGEAQVVAAEVEREQPTEGLMRLRAEVALLRREIGGKHWTGLGETTEPAPHPRLELVARRLHEQGLRPELSKRVLSVISRAPKEEGNPIDPISSDYCRNAVAGMIPGIRHAMDRRARCFAFVGPPGAGKTTTLAKLAEQTRAGSRRALGILSLDGDRPGGGEILAACAERLGIPYRAVRGPEDIRLAIDALAGPSTILLDTAGLGFRDQAALTALRERLRLPGQLAVHLVLPANVETAALLSFAKAYRALEPAAVVFTKIDETRRFGNLVNLPAALDLPVAALTHGRSLARDLAPATRPLVADLLLGRRTPSLEVVTR